MSEGVVHDLEGGGAMWWCPACECGHGGPSWKKVDAITVTPSAITDSGKGRCHSSVIRGKIYFHGDCTNGWAGRVVDLENF